MNFIKTTALLTILTLVVLFTAASLGFDLVSSLIFAFLFNFIMYFFSGSLAIKSTRAVKIQDGQFPEVKEIISFLTQKENMPMPELYVINSDQPNAFATGRNPRNSKVAVTTGIMQLLNRDELEGVLAHELSHIKNRDILVSSIAAMLAAAISFMSRMAFWGVGDRRDRNIHPAFALIAFIAAPIASIIIRMAISRTREFGADATGAEVSGNPLALASALEKIDKYSKIPMNINPAVSQLFISDPLKSFSGKSIGKLFSTHPPTEERVKRLRQRQSGIRF